MTTPRRLPKVLPALTLSALLCALCAPARAELVIGQVLDAQGAPAAGIDLDFLNKRGGGPPLVSNDGTDASGFFTTTVPPGLFDVVFTPPVGTTNLPAVVPNVGVVGTVDLGIITLPEGARLEGRILSHQGLPLSSVAYEVVSESDDTLLAAGLTDLFGEFVTTVPFGPAELRLDPELAPGLTQAPRVMILPMNKSNDLGDVVLQRGFSINATLLLPGGLPAVNVDSDTRDALTGETVWTPGDNSDATGTFHVVLPVGSYDFVVCPKVTTGLLAQEFQSVPIVGDFFGGTHTLQPGVLVTGTVLDSLGQPLKNIDVDLLDPLTGAEVPLCGDNTNVAGQYSIIAPPGTYDLAFTPPHDQFFGSLQEAGVVVSIPVTVNGVLPDCPPPTPYGTGLAGAGGIVPELSTEGGSSRLGNDEFALDISDAVGGASAWLVLGDVQASIPFFSGTLLVDSTPPAGNGPGIVQGEALKTGVPGVTVAAGPPLLIRPLRLRGETGLAGAGQLMLSLPIPDDPSWAGITRYAQVLVSDPAATEGWSLTHGIQITFCE